MERPILTVAIPTYNRADLLALCLDRLFSQLGFHAAAVEILVSNNASTDHTRSIVEKYQQQYSQLRYSENEVNGGPDFNIGKCFELATAKYVWVFSDDDLLLPHAFDHIIPFLQEQEVGVLFLEPRFYRDSIHEFAPGDDPFAYKIYSDPFDALREQHYWITYISGVITNKELVQDSPTLYQFQNSFMIQLGWALPALFQARQNAKITTPLVLGRSLVVLDFKLFHVFGTSYPRVLNSLAASGAIPVAAKELLIELIIKEYFPQYVKPGLKAPHGENPLHILAKSFWNRWSFWTTLVPLFWKKQYVPLVNKVKQPVRGGVKKLAGKLNQKAASSYANRQTDAVINSLKQFGVQSTLPEIHTIVNPQYVAIGNKFRALSMFTIEVRLAKQNPPTMPLVAIGDNVHFGTDCRLDCAAEIRIGNWVMVGHRVLLADNELDEHPTAVLNYPPANRRRLVKGPVIIADNVLVEDDVRIYSGVTIGRNAIIKAGAVVRDAVPANAIVAGNPAVVVSLIAEA